MTAPRFYMSEWQLMYENSCRLNCLRLSGAGGRPSSLGATRCSSLSQLTVMQGSTMQKLTLGPKQPGSGTLTLTLLSDLFGTGSYFKYGSYVQRWTLHLETGESSYGIRRSIRGETCKPGVGQLRGKPVRNVLSRLCQQETGSVAAVLHLASTHCQDESSAHAVSAGGSMDPLPPSNRCLLALPSVIDSSVTGVYLINMISDSESLISPLSARGSRYSPPRSNAPSVASSAASSTLSVATNNTTTPSTPASTVSKSRSVGSPDAPASSAGSRAYWVIPDVHLTTLRKSAGNDDKKMHVFRSILDNDRASHGNNPAAINVVPEEEVVDEQQQQRISCVAGQL
ncbi:uncharacterized protein B0H18DRAFT_1106933 [Fomitopsis serialis]|uniref:uncharacterized protein n=1 Tax=Fomitopsis serialis TaxID=139415 RepID=UPI002008E64C|nr:uncharacterized protein B0H18DRAFT_1106933 [Neoantrodia serialis]KAH9918438.1 hypothetical protein B0H18DRAFT_1106933 [Neoantrodia serialis]